MEQNIFAALTRGARFQKAKTGPVIDLFRGVLHADRTETVRQEVTQKGEDDKVQRSLQLEDDETNEFRNKLQIRVKGNDIPKPCATFSSMGISKVVRNVILQNIEKSSWKEPTPIQMQAIPALLQGRDLLATAPTGSGKTGAFVIPILSKLGDLSSSTTRQPGLKVLVIAPTKELADQIHREMERLAAGKRLQICLLKKNLMATAIASQRKNFFDKYDALVCTPLRVLAVLQRGVADLGRVQLVVLDEADKLFDLQEGHAPSSSFEGNVEEGDEAAVNTNTNPKRAERIRSSFLSQVDEILSHCCAANTRSQSNGVQRALFSATIGPLVRELADGFLHNPVSVSVGAENAGASTIDQRLVFVGREDGKLLAMRQLIQEGLKPPVLLFVQSIERAKDLFKELVYDGINVDVMHAERSQLQREEVIQRFRAGDIWVLICTDLMARGIDFKGVQMVINFDLPQSAVAYIHRIGRTGRAGRRGSAVTFFTERDIPHMRPIANVMRLSGCAVAPWLLNIKQMTTRQKKQLRVAAPLRRKIDTTPIQNNKKTEEIEEQQVQNGGGRVKRKRSHGHKIDKESNNSIADSIVGGGRDNRLDSEGEGQLPKRRRKQKG